MRPIRLVSVVLVLALGPSLGAGSAPWAQGTTDLLSRNTIPDLFASLMNVTLSEEISGASFRIDNRTPTSDATRFQTFKLPWSDELELGAGQGTLHLGAVIGALLAQDALGVDTMLGRATVDLDWTALGGQVEVGWSRPLGRGWILRPGLALGLAHIENEASYNEAGRILLAPELDEVLVNWEAWAALGSTTLTLEHPRDPERLSSGFVGRYSLTSSRTFGATREEQEGSSSSQFLGARGELGGPTGWTRHGEPLSWDVFGAWTGLYDIDETALGFDELYEIGLGLSLRAVRSLPSLRLSSSWIVGPDLRGFSLGLSLAL